MPNDNERFKALADHYKDTFTLVQAYLRQRDWYFAVALVVLIVMLFQLAAPASADRVISTVFGKQFGTEMSIDTTFIGSAIWFLLLAAIFRYFQTVVLIERQHKYVHTLEQRLNHYYGGSVFTRESRWYLNRYPGFSNWAHFIYRTVFPAVILIVATAKIVTDIVPVWPGWWACCVNPYLVFNTAIYAILVMSVALYTEIMRWSHGVRLAAITVWTLFAGKRMDRYMHADAQEIERLDATCAGTSPSDRSANNG